MEQNAEFNVACLLKTLGGKGQSKGSSRRARREKKMEFFPKSEKAQRQASTRNLAGRVGVGEKLGIQKCASDLVELV
jgi:hypothetical protein